MIYHTINYRPVKEFSENFPRILNAILIDRSLIIDKNTNINNYMKVLLLS